MTVMTDMSPAQAAALWSGVMILLLVVLGARVATARRGNKVLLGDGGNARVLLASRVFGNASEYIPAGIGALAVLALLGMPSYVLHGLGAALFLDHFCFRSNRPESKKWSRINLERNLSLDGLRPSRPISL